MPKISVIVPVYNTEKYIKRAVDSILNQTFKDLDIILIDDGSTDQSGVICDEYAKKDSRIVVVHHQKNMGVSIARNIGIDIATGEYIAFADSDDYIENDMYEILYNVAEKEKADMVNCGVRIFDNNREYIGTDFRTQPNKVMGRKEILDYLSSFNVQYISLSCTKLIRRYFITENDIRFYPHLQVQENFIFVLELLLKAESMYFIDKPLYNYVKRENSLTTKKYRNKIYNLFNIAYLRVKHLYENADITGHEKQMQFYFSRYLLSVIKRIKYYEAPFSERNNEIRNICETELFKSITNNLLDIKELNKRNYYILLCLKVLSKLKAYFVINALISLA
ncbi:MAG: glycosyltransferase [Abditibacteriota bacterium]|nr:glycosyltransferase [Abditibacteriota bacterium]